MTISDQVNSTELKSCIETYETALKEYDKYKNTLDISEKESETPMLSRLKSNLWRCLLSNDAQDQKSSKQVTSKSDDPHSSEQATLKSDPPLVKILNILKARDAVEAALGDKIHAKGEDLQTVISLDKKLKTFIEQIPQDLKEDFENCRQNFKPKESGWWWSVKLPSSAPKWLSNFPFGKFLANCDDQFDWFWEVLTLVCLVGAATFMSQTSKAFATGGFDLLGAASTITQGVGVALVAGGALTEKGKKLVETALTSANLPPRFHAEATFIGSVLLLTVSVGLHSNEHKVGEWYYHQAQKNQNKNGSDAEEQYQRAIAFKPDDHKIFLGLGSIYENLGQFDKAKAEYQKGAIQGDAESMNALGRTILTQAWDKQEWKGKEYHPNASLARSLFQRADRRIAQKQQSQKESYLLRPEIAKNRGIVRWAIVNLNAKPDEQAKQLLREANSFFSEMVYREGEIPKEERQNIPAWRLSGQCYQNLSKLVNLVMRVESGSNPDVVDVKRELSCWVFDQDYSPETIDDYHVISTVRDSAENLLRQQNKKAKTLIYNRAVVERLKQKLSQKIKETSSNSDTLQQKIIFRVFVNKSGDIIKYYTYVDPKLDSKSITDIADQTPIPQLWNGDTKEEYTGDFKVVFTPSKPVEIVPWNQGYKGDKSSNPEAKAEPSPDAKPQPSTSSKITDVAEIAVLEDILYEKIIQNSAYIDPNNRQTFDPPLQYHINVTQSGAIASYKPINKEAGDHIKLTPIHRLPTSAAMNEPIAQFKVVFKGIDHTNVFEVSP